MNKRNLIEIEKLSDILMKESDIFIIDILMNKGEQHTSDLISIVLSAHMSSLCNCMNKLSIEHESMNKNIKEFINSLTEFLSKQRFTKDVEVYRSPYN